MKEMTHDRCSELLRPYATGELGASVRDEVEQHLSSCQECSEELAGVQALLVPEVVPMSGIERDELARAVRAAVLVPRKASFFERLGPRLAPALGAVAFLAIAAIAIVSLPNDGRDELANETAGRGVADTESAEGADAVAPASEPEDPEQAQTEQITSGGTTSGGGGSQGSSPKRNTSTDSATPTLAAGTGAPVSTSFKVARTTFADKGVKLHSLIPERVPRRGIAAFESKADTFGYSAPNDRLSTIAQECAQVAISSSPHPLVPVSAVQYADDVLVLGFVWMEPTSGILNYELRGWIDGDCGRVTPIYRRGLIE